MDSDTWGPHGWFFLHTITFTYPDNPSPMEKAQYYNFFNNLQYVLPCAICKKNYPNHLKSIPLDDKALSNRKSLSKWLVDIHNITNKELGKKEMKYKEVIKQYDTVYNKSYNNIGILLVILLGLYLFNKYAKKISF